MSKNWFIKPLYIQYNFIFYFLQLVFLVIGFIRIAKIQREIEID